MCIDAQGYKYNFEAKENSVGTKIYTDQHQNIHENIRYNVWDKLIIIEEYLT